jgi:hypothetical protein
MKNLEKYKKEITHLATKIPGYYHLDRHERQSSINDTLLNLLKKETEGKIELNDYETYKGYMFISIKNSINRHFEAKKAHKITITSTSLEDNTPEETHIPWSNESIKEILATLSPKDRAMLRWIWRGWNIRLTATAFHIAPETLSKKIIRFRNMISLYV